MKHFELKRNSKSWMPEQADPACLYVWIGSRGAADADEKPLIAGLRRELKESAAADGNGLQLYRALNGTTPNLLPLFLPVGLDSRAQMIEFRKVLHEIRQARFAALNLFLSDRLSKEEQTRALLILLELDEEAKIAEKKDDFPKRVGSEEKHLPESFRFSSSVLKKKDLDAIVTKAEILALTRRLVNLPANILSPTALAREARQAGKRYGFTTEVFGREEIEKIGLSAFAAVAAGSDAEPQFIVMRYGQEKSFARHLALVGKGLTYDSGGYYIKPGEGMKDMYTDMGGSAAVVGAISLLAAEKADVKLTAIVAACENMISGHAYRNGDILSSYSGKTIEIVSTDAEGRLTLADAVSYAARDIQATHIVDIATLTGAAVVALGHHYSGVLADDETLWAALEKGGRVSGDKFWRLPADEETAKNNDSTRADLKNSGGRAGGTISAGMFVRAFADGLPWMHLDIAATADLDKGTAFAPAGASGVGAELLAEMSKNFFAAPNGQV